MSTSRIDSALVVCSCGHGLNLHDAGGCRGDRMRRCACVWDGTEALDRAISEVRSTYLADKNGRPRE